MSRRRRGSGADAEYSLTCLVESDGLGLPSKKKIRATVEDLGALQATVASSCKLPAKTFTMERFDSSLRDFVELEDLADLEDMDEEEQTTQRGSRKRKAEASAHSSKKVKLRLVPAIQRPVRLSEAENASAGAAHPIESSLVAMTSAQDGGEIVRRRGRSRG